MRRSILLTMFLAAALPGVAQSGHATAAAPSAGFTVPVTLMQALTAGKTAVGTVVVTRTNQRVPLTRDTYLAAGATVLAVVTKSSAAGLNQPSALSLQFTGLRIHAQAFPFAARTLAIANFTDVDDAASPCSGANDRFNDSPANWTTCQVGGDQVVRAGWVGSVINTRTQVVGFADYNGVYANPVAENDVPHAVGAFSTKARGTYGLDEGAVFESSGSVVTVTSPHKLTLRRGDNLLLEVLPETTSITSSKGAGQSTGAR